MPRSSPAYVLSRSSPGKLSPGSMNEAIGPDGGSEEPAGHRVVDRRGRSREGAKPAARETRRARQAELEELRQALDQERDRYLRAAAELDNMRRRHRQEQADQLVYGKAELIARLLPLLDNFHRALDHVSDAEEPLAAGLRLIVRQFEEMLEQEGVTAIDAVGKPFDPAQHQAVLGEPSAEHEEGTVLEELQRGYMLHDRVLRPALVKVSQ